MQVSISTKQNLSLSLQLETTNVSRPQLVTVTGYLAPSTGSIMCSWYGPAFSANDRSLIASIDKTAAQSSFWMSTTSLMTRSPAGSFLPRHFTATNAEVPYKQYVSTLVRSNTCNQNISLDRIVLLPRTGGMMLSFRMQSSGTMDQSMSLKLGETACISSRWTSDSTAMCKTPEIGKIAQPQIALISIATLADKCFRNDSFASVRVTETNTLSFLKTSSQKIVLIGGEFGRIESSIGARLSTASENSRWISDSIVICRISGGFSSKQFLILSAATLPFVTEKNTFLQSKYHFNPQLERP